MDNVYIIVLENGTFYFSTHETSNIITTSEVEEAIYQKTKYKNIKFDLEKKTDEELNITLENYEEYFVEQKIESIFRKNDTSETETRMSKLEDEISEIKTMLTQILERQL